MKIETPAQAVKAMREMQSQIIHGTQMFEEIAKVIEKSQESIRLSGKALDEAGVAIGNDTQEYTLPERIKWLADVKDTFMRQVDKLRIDLDAEKMSRAIDQTHN